MSDIKGSVLFFISKFGDISQKHTIGLIIGVITVEMETSAMFVVGSFIQGQSCVIFAIFDILDAERTGFLPSPMIGYKNLVNAVSTLFPMQSSIKRFK